MARAPQKPKNEQPPKISETQKQVNELLELAASGTELSEAQKEFIRDNDKTPEKKSKSDPLAPTEEFDGKNLRSVGSGVWRYLANPVSVVSEEAFKSQLAKQYGIKQDDIVHIVGGSKVRTIAI